MRVRKHPPADNACAISFWHWLANDGVIETRRVNGAVGARGLAADDAWGLMRARKHTPPDHAARGVGRASHLTNGTRLLTRARHGGGLYVFGHAIQSDSRTLPAIWIVPRSNNKGAKMKHAVSLMIVLAFATVIWMSVSPVRAHDSFQSVGTPTPIATKVPTKQPVLQPPSNSVPVLHSTIAITRGETGIPGLTVFHRPHQSP